MSNSIMGLIGAFVFIALSVHYRNNPDEYLAILRYDRESSNNTGLNPIDYGLMFITKEQEDNFLNGIDLTNKPWSKYL